jgi:uncharacterized protein (DUF885 family)
MSALAAQRLARLRAESVRELHEQLRAAWRKWDMEAVRRLSASIQRPDPQPRPTWQDREQLMAKLHRAIEEAEAEVAAARPPEKAAEGAVLRE